MKNDTVLFMRWNRPVPGYEKQAAEHYVSMMNYFKDEVDRGSIRSFEPVILAAHASDLGGFILIRGEQDKLQELQRQPDYLERMVRSNVILDRFGVIHGFVGTELQDVMNTWTHEIRKI